MFDQLERRIPTDGGPAFPSATDRYDQEARCYRIRSEGGMTLRDYFAAKAMQALIEVAVNRDEANIRAVPKASYDVADAMLKARQA